MSEIPLPPGYSHITQAEVELPAGFPEKASINQPCAWGPPAGFPLVRVVQCFHCHQDVWRSIRADDELPPLCRDCAIELGLIPEAQP